MLRPPKPYRPRHRPDYAFTAPPSPPPPVVLVANVTQADDPPGVVWTFNRTIASVTLPIHGLTTDGNPVTGIIQFLGSELIVSYDNFPDVGDPWQTMPPVTGISFVGGGAVGGQGGVVQAAP